MIAPPGTRYGRYEIRSHLGSGGMGEVYLAHDTSLARAVALKLLSPTFKDEERLHRFEQEARAISALNHPNILTIYEIGSEDGVHYIATEYVEGETLRRFMSHQRMTLHTVLDFAAQTAAALSAAHHAGIIHRDVKPENLMIRRDGYVKVLDFGLAKLTERRAPDVDTEAPTMFNTEPGVIMGTVAYMSPEQAQGLAVDERTDVWSLGVVIYEMITGHVPFEGQTSSHIIVSILEKEPAAFQQYLPGTPAELERIVTKALAKDKEERYQTIKDLLIDLRRLMKRLDVEAELERSVPPSGRADLTSKMVTGGIQTATVRMEAEPVTRSLKVETEPPATPGWAAALAKGQKALLALAALLLLGTAFGLYRHFNPPPPSITPQSMKIARLTTTGKAMDAAVSPDGKYVVHVSADGGQQSLLIKHIATGSNVQIVPPAEARYRGISFSPDGNYVYYVVREKTNPAGALYQVPVLGGVPRRLLTGVDRPVTFSPDGKQLAFVRNDFPAQGQKALMIANADGGNERAINAPQLPSNFWSPAWSPDGRVIACAAVNFSDGLHVNVIEVNVADGSVRMITPEKWFDVSRLVWVKDGTGLLVTATAQWSGFTSQLWFLSYPGGRAERVTNDLNNYSSLGLTADSNTLVTVQAEQYSNIWTAGPREDAPQARQVTSGFRKYDGYYDLAWAPDGKIVYESTASGNEDIWVMDRDGNNQKQLTSNAGINLFPTVTRDGRYIVFVSTRAEGNTNIWRMDIDGGNPVQLTRGTIDNFPNCSPDGRWVVYMSNVSGKRTLWKVPIEGGAAVQLTEHLATRPAVSPDGKMVACYYVEDAPNVAPKVAVIPFDGSGPARELEIPVAGLAVVPPPLRWTPDGRAIAYVDTRGGISNIWTQPLAGGRPEQVTGFTAERIYSFDWSPDGRQLAVARGLETSDVVLISGFR